MSYIRYIIAEFFKNVQVQQKDCKNRFQPHMIY